MLHNFTTEATGTIWSVSLWSEALDKKDSQILWESCVFAMNKFESTYSRFREDSFLVKSAGKKGVHEVSTDFTQMLEIYRTLHEISDGLITPLGGRLISDLGYDAIYSLTEKVDRIDVPDFDQMVRIVSPTKIDVRDDVSFDFGALGKGYLIDLIMERIREEDLVERILINAGGDIAHWSRAGERARIGLENPDNTSEALGVLELGNAALASSASNKRRWGKGGMSHHIIDPKQKESTQSLKASWVVHERAAISDGLATGLFLTPPEDLEKEFDFSYATLSVGNKLKKSKEFQGAFFGT